MDILPLLIAVAGIHIVALATPGPDFFFVSQIAASQGRSDGMKAMLGISLGVLVWAAVALLGLDILLQKAAWLQQGIMAAGGLYLSYLSFLLFRSAFKRQNHEDNQEFFCQNSKKKYIILKGLLTNLSNPKAIIYFASVFSVFVGNIQNENMKWWILALIIVETLFWFSLVAILFSTPVMQKGYQKFAKWIDGGAGVLFGSFGLYLVYRSLKESFLNES